MIRHIISIHKLFRENAKKRGHKLLFHLFILIFSFAISSCTRNGYEIRNVNSRGTDIICFGDSITLGSGVKEDESYVYLLSQMIGTKIINAGNSGDVAASGLVRLDKDVLSCNPKLVIVEFGGNDFLRKIPMSETVGNIRKIIERIQEKGSMVAVVDVSSGMIMENYRKEYKHLAYETQSIFIPNLLKGIITNPSLKHDPIHPNAGGHRIIAERIYEAISPYLENNLN